MSKRTLPLFSLAIAMTGMGLSGCNENNTDGVLPPSTKTLTVTPSLGRISNARVVLRNAGSRSEIGTQSLVNGQATFRVPASVTTLLAEVVPDTGATYFDEGTGNQQPLPAGTRLRAAFTLTGSTGAVGVTALTEAAVQRAETLAGGGASPALSAAVIAEANALVNDAFNVSNILQAPALVGSANDYAALLNASGAAAQYALRLAALARAAADTLPAGTASPAVAMADALSADLADGRIDQTGTGFPTGAARPYVSAAGFQQDLIDGLNAILAAITANPALGLTPTQVSNLTTLFNTLRSNLTVDLTPAIQPTCANQNMPVGNAAAISEFVGNYPVEIYKPGPVTSNGTLSVAANGAVTLDGSTTNARAICGPLTLPNGTSYLIIANSNAVGMNTLATINLFRNPTGMLSVEGLNFTGNVQSTFYGTKSGGGGNVTPMTATGIAPLAGPVGTTVTLTGTGFDPDKFHMLVKFNNVTAEIISATATQLVVTVPAGATNGAVTITNTLTNKTVTAPESFTVQAGGGGGDSWTKRASPVNAMLNSVTFGGGKFVAVGMIKTITTSTDGITWSTSTGPDNNWFQASSVTHDGNQFVMVGDWDFNTSKPPLIATSPDGITWTRRPWNNPNGETMLVDVTASGGRLTAVGLGGNIITSTDAGVTWTAESQPAGIFQAQELNGVAAHGDTRVAVGRDSSFQGIILINTGGGWTVAAKALAKRPQDVIWTGSQFVAVGQDFIMTSPDGNTWTSRTAPADAAGIALNDVAWDGTKLYAVGDNFASKRVIISSADGGATWTTEHTSTASGSASLAGVAVSANKTLVAVGGVSVLTKP